ncbi:hypothetical protein [Coralloluteibacterium stylophorae]|uniref:Uncharacterized protein n=1 Tax=Coralloluteibacterium stylophorae TaxID=1776034 RepID=A0A8J7VW97_9GAMM|nr:hypothetical protein [Coralloluteibacterium stylophorae]MBS7456483.1 hypothetical protein [Coralloluteibacterium stylophorae]
MHTVRIRFTGNEDAANALMSTLLAVPGVEHVEEVDDLMLDLEDDDSSSAGLRSDGGGTETHDIEIEAPNAEAVRRIHELAEAVAFDMEGAVEFVDEF